MQMDLVHIKVLMAMVCTPSCIAQDVCSNNQVFLGIARNMDAISNAKSAVMYSKLLSMCDASLQCGRHCMSDSPEWIFFEVRKVSQLLCSLIVSSGVDQDDYVLLFHHLEDARYATFLILVSWIHLRWRICDWW